MRLQQPGASCRAGREAGEPGVSVGPGTRVLTRIFRPVSSAAQVRPNERMAALDAA